MPVLLATLAAIAFGMLWPFHALACKCAVQSVAEAKTAASAIFEGRVDAIAEAPAPAEGSPAALKVELSVVRRFKGADRERLTVHTRAHGPACGYDFEAHKSYLVYAESHEGELWVSRCSRTRPITAAQEDLEGLGMGSTPIEVATPKPAEPAAEPPEAETDCSVTAAGGAGHHGTALAIGLLGMWLVRRRLRRP